jgi:RimJ/RimL family protein N-acetyltransferase
MTIKKGSGELERMMLGNKELARGGYIREGMRQLMDAYGLVHYWLRVMPDNEATIAFHKRNGFTVFGNDGGTYENILGERGRYLTMTRCYDGYWPEVPVR